MNSIIISLTFLGCAVVYTDAGPITNESEIAYDKGISAAANHAGNVALEKTHKDDYTRNDIGNTLHNIEAFLVRFIAILKSFAGQPLPALEYVLEGIDKELKNGDGDLVNTLTGTSKGATNGLIDALHKIQAKDTGRLLSGGDNPNTDPKAAEITAATNDALKLAIEKQAKSNEGRSNVDATLHNVGTLLKLIPTYAIDLGTQPSVQLAATAAKGAVDGLKNGLKCGLGKGITGALKGGSEGVDTGLQNAGVNVVKDNLPIGK